MWFYGFPFTVQQDPAMFTGAIMWMLISQFDCVCQKNCIVYGKENMILFTTVKQRGFTEKPMLIEH